MDSAMVEAAAYVLAYSNGVRESSKVGLLSTADGSRSEFSVS